MPTNPVPCQTPFCQTDRFSTALALIFHLSLCQTENYTWVTVVHPKSPDKGEVSMSYSYLRRAYRWTPILALLALMLIMPTTLAQRGPGTPFADETSTRLPANLGTGVSVAVADVNGDGFPDIYIGTDVGSARDHLLINDGTGHFKDEAVRRLPPRDSFGFVRSAQFVDVNGDGNPDLFLTQAAPDRGLQNLLFINKGDGTFRDETASRLPKVNDRSYGLIAADLNGDGSPDLFVANSFTSQDRLYLNDGQGFFREQTTFLPSSAGSLNSTSVALGDINGDGSPDLAVGVGVIREGTPHLFINDGTGRFDDQTTFRLGGIEQPNSFSTQLVDLNGDGTLDLFLCNIPGRAVLFTNNGKGFFSDVTSQLLPLEAEDCRSSVIGDYNGDGKPDIVMGRDPQDRRPNELLVNSDGQGHFIASPLPGDGGANAIASLDVEGDGDLDLLIVNNGKDHLLINRTIP